MPASLPMTPAGIPRGAADPRRAEPGGAVPGPPGGIVGPTLSALLRHR